MGVEIFENDERILMNHMTVGTEVSKLDKQSVISSLDVARVMSENDSEVRELVESTRSKVNLLNDDEWNELRKTLPFDCVEPTDDTMDTDGFVVDKNGILV